MEGNKLLTLLVTITVGIIFIGALLAPVIEDTSATEKTFTNEGAFFVEVEPSESYSIKYDKATEPGVVYINDEALAVEFSTGYTIFAIDNAILRLQSGDYTLQWKGNGQYLTGIKNADLTVSSGAVTGTYIGTTNVEASWPTTEYTTAFIASVEKQNSIMSDYGVPVKMNGDSPIIAFGQTGINNVSYLVKITGTIDDGVTVQVLNSTSGEEAESITVSDVSVNYTELTDYIDLYSLESITFNATLSDVVTPVTYSAYVVPYQVTAELSEHLDAGEIAILAAIPLMAIAALVLLVVRYFVAGRD